MEQCNKIGYHGCNLFGVNMNPILFMLVCFGMIAVCLCFTFLMPLVGKTLVILTSVFFGEKAYSQATKQPSGSEFRDPNAPDGFH